LPVRRDTVSSVIDIINQLPENTRIMVLCPLKINPERGLEKEFELLMTKGFSRVVVDGELYYLEELPEDFYKSEHHKIYILIDRLTVQPEDEDSQFRLADSVQTAFFEGHGDCVIQSANGEKWEFSDRFEMDGITFEEPNVNFFSFNNPYGACKTCEGFGKVLGIDEDLVVPDKNLSVYEGAIAPWKSITMQKWVEPLLKNGIRFDFPIHRPYYELNDAEREVLWIGNEYFKGINDFFRHLESKTHKIQYRVLLSRYRGRTTCPDCRGTRLRKDASYVKINEKSITDLVLMPVERALDFFNQIKLSKYEEKVARRILQEITNRLEYVTRVGLGYLTLNRLTSSLSGGEFQRIKLATSLGSALVGSMYILDEPSIGLHPRDTQRLLTVLLSLRDLGNSVIVVEHEEELIKRADQVIDIGPDAGTNGGELVFQGTMDELIEADNTHTARFLNGNDKIEIPLKRRKWLDYIKIVRARENNLKNIDVTIPLEIFTVITGVSGSGKSTLVKKVLYPAIGKILGTNTNATGKFDQLTGDYKRVTQIEFVDQNPIGKSSRSNPVTYVKAYDHIRQLFSDQSLAKRRAYKPSHFSFNVDGGRCEVCQGEGTVKIEMQFMADIYLTCEGCDGLRFKQEVLEVKFNNKNIAEVLDMTVNDAVDFFKNKKSIINKLKPLQDVGMGYVRLGQSSNSLSGGEAQRVKLASFLGKGNSDSRQPIMFIFDEPTTGLHYHDIKKLLKAINALVDQGNSVIVIEHNMEMIKSADWIIDLGPEGGEKGGAITFAGSPEDMIKLENNHTAQFLKEKFTSIEV